MSEQNAALQARETRWNRSIATWTIEPILDPPGGMLVTLYSFSGEQVQFMMDAAKTTQFIADLWRDAPHQ